MLPRRITIVINKSAVAVGVVALVLFMHIYIGIRLNLLRRTLQGYNDHITEQVEHNRTVNRVLEQHWKMISGNLQINSAQSLYLLPQLQGRWPDGKDEKADTAGEQSLGMDRK